MKLNNKRDFVLCPDQRTENSAVDKRYQTGANNSKPDTENETVDIIYHPETEDDDVRIHASLSNPQT